MKFLIILVSLLFALTGCFSEEVSCKDDVCINNKTKQFEIEEGASISVMVENESIAEELQLLWDKQYPEHKGVINPIVIDEYDGVTFLNVNADVAILWESEAAKLDNYIHEIDERVADEISDNLVSNYGKELNYIELQYVPMSAVGWVFSTNKTMLQELGVDVSDENMDGLVDALDSFEKINEWVKTNNQSMIYREEQVEEIFRFNFDDNKLILTLLSFGSYQPFESLLAHEPGFNSNEFLKCLNDIASLGEMSWAHPSNEEIMIDNDDVTQEFSKWNAEFYLRDGNSVFNFVSTWMHYDQYEESTDQDFLFSSLPSFDGEKPLTYGMSRGYVINSDTKYINASLELIKLIRSEEGLQIFAKHSSDPLLVNFNDEDLEIEFSNENLQQLSYAMMNGFEESNVAFERDTSVSGWQVFEETEILDILVSVYYQEISPEEAQDKIIEISNQWIELFYSSDDQ